MKIFFLLPKQENRPAEKQGSFLRFITFPFCPAALAQFIQPTVRFYQTSEARMLAIKKKEEE